MKPTNSIVYSPEWQPEGSRTCERYRWVENASRGLRVRGTAHELREICRIEHTGWWLDPIGDGETVHGVVLQLPGRSGFARFVPAVSDPFNDDCYVVDFHDHYDAPGNDTDDALRDCIYAADHMAECYAEREREYQTKETAKLRIGEALERIAQNRAVHRDAVRELRSHPDRGTPTLCLLLLRRQLSNLRAEVHSLAKEIRKLQDDPYSWLY